ncbi:MAG: hypothetical protein AAGF50_02190 [Pseudomonadota bacterium]
MTALRMGKDPVRAVAPYMPSDEERRFLNLLRLVGRDCRAKARADLFQACATLSVDSSAAKMAHAEVLMRCLSQALEKTPIFYRPGEQSLSFDEAWLLQLASAIARGDTDSRTFLLHSRIVPHARRNCAFLVSAIVDQFSLN